MEIEARVILLGIGFIILAGVSIDFMRRRMLQRSRNPIRSNNDLLQAVFSSDNLERQAQVVRSTPAGRKLEDMAPISHLDKDFEIDTKIDAINPEIEEYIEEEIIPVQSRNLLTLSIMSRHPSGFDGDELYKALSRANCHCVNNVFYRYTEDYGGGERLFSIVQAVEPGIFDIEKMGKTRIPGITLIIEPEQLDDRDTALEQLIRTAKQVAFVLNGELLDSEREPLTLETIAQYRTRIKAM